MRIGKAFVIVNKREDRACTFARTIKAAIIRCTPTHHSSEILRYLHMISQQPDDMCV